MSDTQHDEVIALMAQQGLTRVQATKLLYEQVKQRKKDASSSKLNLNINQGGNSTVKNHIEKFSSQRDLSAASSQVHHDIDLSEAGRPTLKLDAEMSFRYTATMPSPVDVQTQAAENSPQRLLALQNQSQRERSDTGSEDEEAVIPYEEDKFTNSPKQLRSGTSRGVAGGGGWNGELEEDEFSNAPTASFPDTAPKRRSSNSSLTLRPLSRLHPNKFRDSLTPEDAEDYDEDDSGSDFEGLRRSSSDNDGDNNNDNILDLSVSRSPVSKAARRRAPRDGEGDARGGDTLSRATASTVTTSSSNSNRQYTATTATSSTHAASTVESASRSRAVETGPSSSSRVGANREGEPRDAPPYCSSEEEGSPLPPSYNDVSSSSAASRWAEQQQQKFTNGAAGSWSTGSQSNSAPSYERSIESDHRNLSARGGAPYSQSTQNVQQLAVEERLALLNAGRSSSSSGHPVLPALGSPSGTVSATNVKVGNKKLTIRAAGSASSAGQTAPVEESAHMMRDLPPPPPPPSYEESAQTATLTATKTRTQHSDSLDMPQIAADPLPDFYPDSDEEEDDLDQEQRTAALMTKYKRRSYMRQDNTPEAFRNLAPVDPAEIAEMLRREQEAKNAGKMSSDPLSYSGGTATPPIYTQEVPTHTAVEAVMHKNSNDLIEELIDQGYSRENAISLAKEIELDRRAGRFVPRSSQDGSVSAAVPLRSGGYNNNNNNNNNSSSGAWAETSRTSFDHHPGADDDLVSVLSNISASSRQSGFNESDRMLMNLLLAQQKSRYGMNMYESLCDADEPTIERFMSRGMTLDQAVLKVFETKFGPVDSQALPQQLQGYNSSRGGGGGTIAYDSHEAHEIVETMHAEIELLMLSGDYTRDVAVRMLLNKVAKERAQNNGMNNSDHSRLHRAASMNAMGSPKARSGGGGSTNGSTSTGTSRYDQQQQQQQQHHTEITMVDHHHHHYRSGGLHSTRSMYDGSSSARGGSSVVSERSSRSRDVSMPHHYPGDVSHNHHQNDFAAQYHQQEYNRGPNGRRTGGEDHNYHHSQRGRRPSASNGSVSSGKAADEYLPTLLAEQEAAFGVNMFEYLAPDDPEVARLMDQFDFSRTDAMIAVFQQFPPQLVTPSPPVSGGSRRGDPRDPPRSSHHSSREPRIPVTSPLSSPNVRRPPAGPPPAATSSSSHSNPAYDEDAELERVMKLSMQEHANKPGAVSMPGVGSSAEGGRREGGSNSYSNYSSNNNHGGNGGGGGSGRASSSQDINSLVGMGFTSSQAHDALSRHNFDVHAAANYLLGGI